MTLALACMFKHEIDGAVGWVASDRRLGDESGRYIDVRKILWLPPKGSLLVAAGAWTWAQALQRQLADLRTPPEAINALVDTAYCADAAEALVAQANGRLYYVNSYGESRLLERGVPTAIGSAQDFALYAIERGDIPGDKFPSFKNMQRLFRFASKHYYGVSPDFDMEAVK